MTGQHFEGTSPETLDCLSFIDDLATEYVTVTASRPDVMRSAPATPKADLADLATTSDIQDVFDEIAQTRPADVRLRSTMTEDLFLEDAEEPLGCHPISLSHWR